MELTPERIHPCKVQTNLLQAGAAVLSWQSPSVRQLARPPEAHNALAPAQKTPTFIADNVPTYHVPTHPFLESVMQGGAGSNSSTTTWVS